MIGTKNFNLFRKPGVLLHSVRRERPKFASVCRWLPVAAICAGLLGLSGCGASGTKPQLGAISVTDPSGAIAGQLTSVIINANPSHAGLNAPLPWGYIAFYLVSNIILAAYAVVLVRLIVKKRKSAIAHNAVYGILTIIFLAAWHFLGMKSLMGTVVDSLPGVVGILYFALSARVKETLAG